MLYLVLVLLFILAFFYHFYDSQLSKTVICTEPKSTIPPEQPIFSSPTHSSSPTPETLPTRTKHFRFKKPQFNTFQNKRIPAIQFKNFENYSLSMREDIAISQVQKSRENTESLHSQLNQAHIDHINLIREHQDNHIRIIQNYHELPRKTASYKHHNKEFSEILAGMHARLEENLKELTKAKEEEAKLHKPPPVCASAPVPVHVSKPPLCSRLVFLPKDAQYQEKITQLIEVRKQQISDLASALPSIRLDLNDIISQITSDRNDPEHLNGRANVAKKILQQNPGSTEEILSYLAEYTLKRGIQNISGFTETGTDFSYNYIEFLMQIAKDYTGLYQMTLLSILSKRRSFAGLFLTDQNVIQGRSELADYKEGNTMDEQKRAEFEGEMNRAIAQGYMFGTLLVHNASIYNVGDVWRWLATMLKLPCELIDRSYVAILQGFLIVTLSSLHVAYAKQYSKLLEVLKAFVQLIRSKFEQNPRIKAYCTQLEQVIINAP